jgi:hypothetical protein
MKWRRRRRRRGITTIHSNFIIRDRRREDRFAAMLAYYGACGDCEGMGV